MSKRDAEQVQKVLAGDQAAYEPLVEAYQGRIFAFVAGRIRNFSATEDIVQNAFVEAYMHLKSLKSPEKFAGWLRGIALNLSNKWLQQKRPIISIDDTSRDITPEISEFPLPDLPDEALEKSEKKEAVIAAVDALPDIYRESVLLHYMEGMTYPEIAAFLDVPESTVTGRLQVARNRLRDELMPLVEDTLREKRPRPQLTRKVMAALPPLLYAMPTQASLLAKLKGTGMIKIIGIIGAGIAGTGLYFGGISAVLNWGLENNELPQTSQLQLELENLAQNEQPIPEKTDETDGTKSSQQKVKSDSTTSGDTQTEKLDFGMESSPQDSLIKIVYWIPEAIYSDSVFIELDCFNIQGARVAKPVNKTHASGSYTTFLSKRGLPDGTYFVRLRANRSDKNEMLRKLNLIWTDRNGKTKTEKLDFGMESTPQDSLIKIVYWIPEAVYSDSVFVEIDFYNSQGARAAKPVNKMHNPGSYTTFLSKRRLPDGRYLVRLSATQQSLKEHQEVHHALELVWRYRYQYGGNVQQKMDFKIVRSPQASIMEIAYWIPEKVYSDPVFIELDFFNSQGARVAKPVNKTHAPGSYTAFLPKRGLPDGTYFVRLRANRSEENAVRRSLNLIWLYRNRTEPKYPIDLKIESSPQDSLVKIVYSIPEGFHPAFVEIIFFNNQNMMVAKPVNKTHAPGSYTKFLSKRGLPDGTYWVKMAAGRDFTLQGSLYSPYVVRRRENLIWTERK